MTVVIIVLDFSHNDYNPIVIVADTTVTCITVICITTHTLYEYVCSLLII